MQVKKLHHNYYAPMGVRVCRDGIRRNTILPVPPEKRFWKFVDKRGKDECWLWTGNVTGSTSKYPAFFDGKKEVKGHRFSYELHIGPIPAGLLACHHCDNKLCVNPAHLFTGTHKDNTADAKRKNRLRWGNLYGEENPLSKWKEKQVLKVVRLWKQGMPLMKVAKKTGVTRTSVGAIVQGRVWYKLTGLKHPRDRQPYARGGNIRLRRIPAPESAIQTIKASPAIATTSTKRCRV